MKKFITGFENPENESPIAMVIYPEGSVGFEDGYSQIETFDIQLIIWAGKKLKELK